MSKSRAQSEFEELIFKCITPLFNMGEEIHDRTPMQVGIEIIRVANEYMRIAEDGRVRIEKRHASRRAAEARRIR